MPCTCAPGESIPVGDKDRLHFASGVMLIEFSAPDLYDPNAGQPPPWLTPEPDIVQEICAGMAYLSAQGEFAHLDLKPSNVLIDAGGHAKIADFGVSMQIRIRDGRFAAAPGSTWAYAAPEVIRGEPCDSRADIFSFGVLLYEQRSDPNPRVSG